MANPLPFSFDDQHQQYPPPLFPPGHILHETDDSFEEERKKKRQKTIENILVASSGAAFTVALVATRVAQKRLYNGFSSSGRTHRNLPRPNRRVFDHARAAACINQDYMGPDATFNGVNFKQIFRISRARFESIVQTLCNSNNFWHDTRRNCFGNEGASTLAKVLLPLKCLAFGVPTTAFLDYFQLSPTLAKSCYEKFVLHIPLLFTQQYLAPPTKQQMKEIVELHQLVHGVRGMLGSLDCMHTYWDKCPKAFHGSFKGKEKRPSVVLEAACDYNLYFWHCDYGFPGTYNDLNIINASSLLAAFVDGYMTEFEQDCIPFSILDEEFMCLYWLVDGIYPTWARFVKAISEDGGNPVSSAYKIWQEAKRKDIERAFGVLQLKWQMVARPFKFHKSEIIANTVTTCLILHNMCVHERVNETIEGDYSPLSGSEMPEINVANEHADDNPAVSNNDRVIQPGDIPAAQLAMAQRMAERYNSLIDRNEHMRLRDAISAYVHANNLHISRPTF